MSLVLLRTQSDERLIALARDGHERAFEAIVKRYRRQLLAACRRMVPEARAEDVLQQALVSAWGALRRGDDVHDLRAWLFRIARNTAISALRGPGHPEPPALLGTLVAAPSPQEEAERRAVVRETLEAVAGLPERQREALLRIAVQGHSQDEVAEELGLSRVAVRQLVHRARTSLRAAASAVVPFPVVAWLASAGAGAEPMSLRIGQLIAGAGGAGAGATLLKAGAVAGVAGAVSAPILAEHHASRAAPARAAPALTATPRAVPAASVAPVATARPPVVPVASVVPAPRHEGAGDDRAPASGGGGAARHRARSQDDDRGESRDESERSVRRAAGGVPGRERDGGDDAGRERDEGSGAEHDGGASGRDSVLRDGSTSGRDSTLRDGSTSGRDSALRDGDTSGRDAASSGDGDSALRDGGAEGTDAATSDAGVAGRDSANAAQGDRDGRSGDSGESGN